MTIALTRVHPTVQTTARMARDSDAWADIFQVSEQVQPACTCTRHVTRMSPLGTALYCETEANAYCNFECVCGHDDYDPREVEDSTARTIAGWWASPGCVGNVLAALSTGCVVDLPALLEDIHLTRVVERPTGSDSLALDVLATWAIRTHNLSHPRRPQ